MSYCIHVCCANLVDEFEWGMSFLTCVFTLSIYMTLNNNILLGLRWSCNFTFTLSHIHHSQAHVLGRSRGVPLHVANLLSKILLLAGYVMWTYHHFYLYQTCPIITYHQYTTAVIDY